MSHHLDNRNSLHNHLVKEMEVGVVELKVVAVVVKEHLATDRAMVKRIL